MAPIAVPIIDNNAANPAAFKAKSSTTEISSPYTTYKEYIAEHPDFPAQHPEYVIRHLDGPRFTVRFLPYDDEEGAPPHGTFDHVEPATRADPAMPNLLKEGVVLEDLTPHIGTFVRGTQLTELSPAALDEVALLGELHNDCIDLSAAAQRGVLVFQKQNLKDSGPDAAVRIGKHFGPLHHHPIMWRVKGHMDLQIVYEGPE